MPLPEGHRDRLAEGPADSGMEGDRRLTELIASAFTLQLAHFPVADIVTTPYLSLPIDCLPASLHPGGRAPLAEREWGRPQLLNTLLLILRECVDMLCIRSRLLESCPISDEEEVQHIWTDKTLGETPGGDVLAQRLLPCLRAIFVHGLLPVSPARPHRSYSPHTPTIRRPQGTHQQSLG